MKKQHYFFGAFLAAAISPALAGTPTYSYFRTVDLGTTASGSWRATSAVADAAGFLYMTNNQNDQVGYMNPLTANVPADVQIVYDGLTPSSGFGASSFMGIAIDGSGTIFASGTNVTVSPTSTRLMRIVNTGVGTWTKAFVSGISSVNGGTDAALSGLLGMSDYFTGAVRSYLVSGTSAFQLGSDEPAGGVPDVIKTVADTATETAYQSIAINNLAGRVDILDTEDVYPVARNPYVAPLSSSFLKTAELHYQQISIDRDDKALVVSTNRGTQGDNNTFKLYDLTQTGPSISSYQTINGTGTGGPVFGAGRICYGSAFFTQAGQKYLFLMVSNNTDTWTGYVYKKNTADISGWPIY